MKKVNRREKWLWWDCYVPSAFKSNIRAHFVVFSLMCFQIRSTSLYTGCYCCLLRCEFHMQLNKKVGTTFLHYKKMYKYVLFMMTFSKETSSSKKLQAHILSFFTLAWILYSGNIICKDFLCKSVWLTAVVIESKHTKCILTNIHCVMNKLCQ